MITTNVIIPENERTKSKWDIEENKGFQWKIVNHDRKYKVFVNHRSKKNIEKVALLLNYIEQYVEYLKYYLSYNTSPKSNQYIAHQNVFIDTPHIFQEIGSGTLYEGINKPKNIIHIQHPPKLFSKDNQYRAEYRLIMLSLRTKTGNLRTWNKIKRLLLHELAHTMCNHITYREEGNHEKDFDDCESILHNVASLGPVKEFENNFKWL